MPVQNIGSMQDILSNYNAKDWSKSATINDIESMDFGALGKDLDLPKAEKTTSFSEMLSSSMMDVNQLQKDADIAVQKLASGQTKNLHETMLSVEKAEIAFKTMNQIRTKVIDAYKEIMRMQV
jgi:flagellar hook-basal body complex protein FliE